MRLPWTDPNAKKPISAAAGASHAGPSPVRPDFIAKRRERWQERVIQLITAVPEPSGASALVENTLSKVKLRIEGDIEKSDAKELEELLKGFDMGRAGMLLWQVGECYPLWRQNEFDEIEWEVNSPLEIEAQTGKSPKLIGPDNKPRALQEEENIFRIWKQDPSRKYQAWSPHKGLLDLLEAMYLHQLADTAVATSRLAGAGLLFWPTDLPSLPVKDGNPAPGSREELQQELMMAMQQSISDRNSTDAFVPLIVFGDPTVGENFKPEHILLERPDNAKAWSERMDTYSRRYARGVELPVESVNGMGPANHWTAWVIKEDKWRFYIHPIAELVVHGLLRNFVRPILLAQGYEIDIVKNVKLIADGTTLIEKPDKSDAAIRLAQLGGILNDEAVLRETGFDPVKDKGDGVRESKKTRLQELPAKFRENSNPGSSKG